MANSALNANVHHVTYGQRWEQWQRIRDFREGADQVKRQGTLYLPSPSGMDLNSNEGKAEYANYRERASFYPVVDRTVEGITGVAFVQNPEYVMPAQMDDAGLTESLTIDGESADTLAHLIVDEVISVGRFGLLVDLPEAGAPDARAYVSKYFAEHIRDWRREIIKGRQILTMVMLEDGRERVNDRDAIRFLRLRLLNAGGDEPMYQVEEWVLWADEVEKTKEGDPFKNPVRPPVFRTPMVREQPLGFIPFVFVNPKTLQPEIERPPCLDLVDVNKGHYINAADYEHCLYAGAHDTFYIIGSITDQEKPREIGGGIIWTLPDSVKEVGTLSASGTSMDALMDALMHKEEQMAALGARLIHQQKAGQPETAEAVRIRSRENASVLMKVIDNSEEAMQRVFRYAAILMDLDPDQTNVLFNRDFVEARLTWDDAVKLVQVWQTGGMDEESYFDRAKRGGMLPAELTFEEWKKRIEAEKEKKAEAAKKAGLPDPNDPNAKKPNEDDPDGDEEDDAEDDAGGE